MSSSTPIPEGKYVKTANGLTIHYHEAGSGEPVVFIHGSGPGASGYSNFKGNFRWFAERNFHSIVPDMPGFGLSSKPTDVEYTLDFFVESLHGFLNTIGITRSVLLGNSLGGAIALGYALAHPAEVNKLVLMAPGGVEERETYFQMEGIREMINLFMGGGIDANSLRGLLSKLVYDASLVTDDLVAERLGVYKLQHQGVLATMKVPNMTSRLGEIKCPVLGLWGTKDLFNPVSGAMKILDGCADARFVLVNRCGHWVMVEHRDLFNHTCLDFLNR